MPVHVACPSCKRTLAVPDSRRGQKVRCPKCAAVLATRGQEVELPKGSSYTIKLQKALRLR